MQTDMDPDKATDRPKCGPGESSGAVVQGRRRCLRLAALASPKTLETLLDGFFSSRPQPDWRLVRGPESGLVMLRARIGGTGPLFNVGEALVTRCTIMTESGTAGCGYVLGESPRHAELAALLDALWQDGSLRGPVEKEILPFLEQELTLRNSREAARTAPTKVDFFTLVRGEDKD